MDRKFAALSLIAIASCSLPSATLLGDEVLVERSNWSQPTLTRSSRDSTYHYETKSSQDVDSYLFGSIAVQDKSWTMSSVTGYFEVTAPSLARQLRTARLTIIPTDGRQWPEKGTPIDGSLKQVQVRELEDAKGVFSATAEKLEIKLERGTYWIALTPHVEDHCQYFSLFTKEELQTGIEPIVFAAEPGESTPKWSSYHVAFFRSAPYNRNTALRITGSRQQLGEVSDAKATEAPREARLLHLRAGTFDPKREPPEVLSKLQANKNCELHLVQFRNTPMADDQKKILALGAEILNYVPDDAFLVHAKPHTIGRIGSLDRVRCTVPWHPAFRIDPSIDGNDIVLPRSTRGPWKNCFVLLNDKHASEKIGKRVREFGGKVLAEVDNRLVAVLQDEHIHQLSLDNQVLYIERYGRQLRGRGLDVESEGNKQKTISMSSVREILGANYLEKKLGCVGAGVRCVVVDSSPRSSHIDLRGRIFEVGPQTRRGDDHGTSVAGVVAGDGTGSADARGIAPKAHLLYLDMDFDGLVDKFDLIDECLARGGVLQTDSSGSEVRQWYNSLDEELDELIWKKNWIYCRAVGNQGNRMGTTWSKNAIVVGGIYNNRSITRSDFVPWNASTRGPAPDDRIKPDVVAFAQDVLTVGSANDRDYYPFGGTSCATPITAGCVALICEMWAEGGFGQRPLGTTIQQRRPAAATAKALLINTAHQFEMGNSGFTRMNQGWGMPDLKKMYEHRDAMLVVNCDQPISQGKTITYSFDSRGEGFQATLCWTDPPAMPGTSRALVNDLHLVATSPSGSTYLGNAGLSTENHSSDSQKADELNNLEQVIVDSPEQGEWKVQVIGQRIAIDQHLSDDALNQVFALVIR